MWTRIRGYKRHAGAVVMALGLFMPLIGLDVDPRVWEIIKAIGTVLWGVGWIDKGARWVQGED